MKPKVEMNTYLLSIMISTIEINLADLMSFCPIESTRCECGSEHSKYSQVRREK
jgi:hypothetical protein